MRGVLKKVTIDHKEIKKPTQICFGERKGIYMASITYDWCGEQKQCSPGEYYISEINGDDSRYVHPDAPDRVAWDYFSKIVVEVQDNGYGTCEQFDLRWSEWQIVDTCLLGREVEIKLCFHILGHRKPLECMITHIYSRSPADRAEEALIRIRDISQPHWTHHKDWNNICEIAKSALKPEHRPDFQLPL